MDETRVVVRKKVEGRVQYNDGEFVEVQTVGIEGIEKDLLLETIQIQCEDTNDTPDEFERRFPVGMWLDIFTTTYISVQTEETSLQNDGDRGDGKGPRSVQ